MDSAGVLRVGGRIGNSKELPYDTKRPIIIPPGSRICELIIADAHMSTYHGAIQVMMQYIRAIYWIPRLRAELRAYTHKCVICARYAKKLETQLMGDLPEDRVNKNRAFLISGVDFAGPVEITEHYKRKSSRKKCWIAIFVCMVTRAIHIDIVTDLSSAAFIMCYERFIARRGHCNKRYSDNGTSFVGMNKELKIAFENWSTPEVIKHL